MTTAMTLLKWQWTKKHFVCVGLDTDPDLIPPHLIEKNGGDKMEAVYEFNVEIVKATHYLVLGYKINSAFYEGYGPKGIEIFERTCAHIKETASDCLLIKDMKRGDIGNTNLGYARHLEGADAITISGYFGKDANEPFLDEKFKDKLIFILAKTSNKGSAEIQDLMSEGMPVYLHMAKKVMRWGNNCALVVGGTHPNHLLQVRSMIGPEKVILSPGAGAQGADLKSIIVNGTNEKGEGLIVNASRSVIYAFKTESAKEEPGYDINFFARPARREVIKMNEEILEYLELPKVHWEDVMPAFCEEKAFEILAKEEAILKDDHFVYQAGDHGDAYVAKDKISPNPLSIDEIGRLLAMRMQDLNIETIVAPACGGIVLGHAVARYLCYFKGTIVNSVFLEKTGEKNEDGTDQFGIVRGYEKYLSGKKIAVVEDILNSGSTVKNIINCVSSAGGDVIAVGAICNRGKVKPEDIAENITLVNLTVLDLKKFPAKDCPLCASDVPINTIFGHGKTFLAAKNKG